MILLFLAALATSYFSLVIDRAAVIDAALGLLLEKGETLDKRRVVEQVREDTSVKRWREDIKKVDLAQQELNERLNEEQGREKKLRLYGAEIPVPGIVAIPVWSALLFLFVAYVARKRNDCFVLLSRYIRSVRAHAGNRRPNLIDVAGAAPIWLAPLPFRDGNYVRAVDLKSMLGWDHRHVELSFGTGIVAAILLSAQIYALWLAAWYYGDVGIGAGFMSERVALVLMLATYLFAGGTVWLIWRRILMWPVPDHEADQQPPADPTRRQSAAFVLITAMLVMLGARTGQRSLVQVAGFDIGTRGNNPRYVKRIKLPSVQTKLSRGFYRNPSSDKNPEMQTVHYVDTNGNIRGIRSEAIWRRFESIPDDEAHTPEVLGRMPQHYRDWDMEHAAIELIQLNQRPAACDLLLAAVKMQLERAFGSPDGRFKKLNLRVFDLLAGLSVREDHVGHLDQMIDRIEKSPPRVRREIGNRVKKWRDTDGQWRWRERWTNRQHTIKWRWSICHDPKNKDRCRRTIAI
ncbi:MAG: hypothetical protein V3S40_13845 [Kiloniellales bacterium]